MQHFTATVDPSGAQQLSRISNTTKTALQPSIMVQELTLTAFREQIAFSHLLSNYRWGPFWKPVLRVSLDGATQSDVVKADYTGSLATALGFMGARVNEPTMLAEGYELNGRVIRALQSALLTKSKIDLAHWAVTITILSLYQVSHPVQVKGSPRGCGLMCSFLILFLFFFFLDTTLTSYSLLSTRKSIFRITTGWQGLLTGAGQNAFNMSPC